MSFDAKIKVTIAYLVGFPTLWYPYIVLNSSDLPNIGVRDQILALEIIKP